jgi:hypothetical protein
MFSKGYESTYRCSKVSIKGANCALCMDDLFNSQMSSITVKCGHAFHMQCIDKYARNKNYKCPICRKLYLICLQFGI